MRDFLRSRPRHSEIEEPPLALCCDGAARARHVTARQPAIRPAAAGQGAGEPAARRRLRLSLAALWLLDAALQFQSFMFGRGFSAMLAQSARGNPAVVAVPITWAAHVIGQHPAAANGVFAACQLALGLGIAWRPTVKIALAGSAGWAVAVWWLGEGFGGLLSGSASPVSGAPGAVIIYALLAVLLWPADRPGRRPAFPAAQAAGPAVARAVWLLLWGGLAWLAAAHAPAATVAVLRQPPGSLLLAALFAVIAAGVLLPAPLQRAAVLAAVVMSLVLWAAGQGFGGVFTGTGTDPSTGPVLVLLALAYWPARRAAFRHPAPGRRHAVPGHAAAGHRAGPHPTTPGPASSRPVLPAAGRDAVAMQVLMGLGMAGMLLPGLLPLPVAAWIVLAGLGAAWFCGRFLHGLARARPGRHAALDHLPHAVACAAMLCMFAAGMPDRAGAAAGAMGTGQGAGPAPVAALILTAALAGCAAVLTDRLAAPRPAPGAAQPAPSAPAPSTAAPGTAPGAPALSTAAPGAPAPGAPAPGASADGQAPAGGGLLGRRVAACCQLAMGVGMACLLVQLL
ncbi:MAG: DUF5134 domain-containing protein [Gemmatimonadota bacterium]